MPLGNYPALPANRMAYDRDGTVLLRGTSVVTEQSQATKQTANNEASNTAFSSSGSADDFTWMFPEPRDLLGYYWAATFSGNGYTTSPILVSADTTTGLDGTWTNVVANSLVGMAATVESNYRTSLQAVADPAALGIIAVKWQVRRGGSVGGMSQQAFHLYGAFSGPAPEDRLELWDPIADERVDANHFNWGDAPRDSIAVRQFRVANLSADRVATDVTVTTDALTPGSPNVAAMHEFSTDEAAWGPSIVVPSIAPASQSPILYVRRNLTADAPLGLRALRIVAEPATFLAP